MLQDIKSTKGKIEFRFLLKFSLFVGVVVMILNIVLPLRLEVNIVIGGIAGLILTFITD